MPGEAALDVSQYPDDFQTVSFALTAAVAPVAVHALFTTDRDIVVDKVAFAAATVSAETVTLRWSPSATVPASTADNGTTFNDLTVAVATNAVAAYVKQDLTLNPTNAAPTRNIIPAGSTVYAVFSAVATVRGTSFTIRFRSRRQ